MAHMQTNDNKTIGLKEQNISFNVSNHVTVSILLGKHVVIWSSVRLGLLKRWVQEMYCCCLKVT